MNSSNRETSRKMSVRMAFCGLIAALTVTLMLAGGIIPIATYCVPMAASILLLPVHIEFGKRTAWITFFASALIALFLGIDKEAAFFYLFIGHYPLIKWDLDRIKRRYARIAAKLLTFSLLIILMYLILGFVLNTQAILQEFGEMGLWFTFALLVLFDICMLLYDRLLLPMVFLYATRIKPRLRFLLH